MAIDFSYHTRPDGLRFIVANFIDEASRFHIGKVIKESYTADSDESLGNADADDVLEALQNDWLRWMQSPKRIHVDADGVFTSGKLADLCARRHIGNGVAGRYRSICQLHVLLPVGWCPCDAILRLLLFVNVMIQIIILVSVHYLCLALGWRIYTNAYSRNNASNDIPFILYTYSVGCLSWR